MCTKQNITTEPSMSDLRQKRKKLDLTQDEFADLFDMKKDNYRKYEEGVRTPPVYVIKLMMLIIGNYENRFAHTSPNTVSNHSFLEVSRQECLNFFCEEQHDIVNLIFDYLTRKAE